MNQKTSTFLFIGAIMMALGIAIGAFGAHGLKSRVDEAMLVIYNTGVSYHFYNTLGLFAVAFLLHFKENVKLAVISGWLMLFGTIVFSGSLYILVLFNTPWFGAITPIGGTSLIIAWILFAISIKK